MACKLYLAIAVLVCVCWVGTESRYRTSVRKTSCRDTGRNCASSARSGMCRYNPWNRNVYNYMRRYCRLSCRVCKPRNRIHSLPQSSCLDSYRNCASSAKSGLCRYNPWNLIGYNYMTKYCRRSCGLCKSTSRNHSLRRCRDENRHCKSWSRTGQCIANPAYMTVKCRKSCKTCYKSKPKPKTTLKPKHKTKRPSSRRRPSALLNSRYCGITSMKVVIGRKVKRPVYFPWKKVIDRQITEPVSWPMKRVIGGQATRPREWPWMVGLERKGQPGTIICGASLLTDEWILSATHCFLGEGKTDPSKYLVRFGEIQTDGELLVKLDKIITHENFDVLTYDNDIALLHLAKRIKFTPTIRPACIPDQGEYLAVGAKCTVTGWGELKEGKGGSDVLHSAEIPIVDQKLCVNNFKKIEEIVTERMFCAGHSKGGIDTCKGDSGGPLVCRSASDGRYKQAGLVSWGIGCARPNLFGVYTKLSKMRNWINTKVNA